MTIITWFAGLVVVMLLPSRVSDIIFGIFFAVIFIASGQWFALLMALVVGYTTKRNYPRT